MSENEKPVSSAASKAFNVAARTSVTAAIGSAIAGFIVGDFSIMVPAIIFSTITAGGIAHDYEKKIEAAAEKARIDRRPSEGPGW
ncbi:MAG: hypothetical protein KJ667_09305 [Alphaproteobacteria bacterium]|nr:hypothetical protein [Alphaproteobacteria bacterium]